MTAMEIQEILTCITIILSVFHTAAVTVNTVTIVMIVSLAFFKVSYRNVPSLPCNRIMKCCLSFGHCLEKQTRWQEHSRCPVAALFES